jgi:hypothetical protein
VLFGEVFAEGVRLFPLTRANAESSADLASSVEDKPHGVVLAGAIDAAGTEP